MKKIVFISFLSLIFLSSCDKNAEVKRFMKNLAMAIEANDTITIKHMYPDAAKADSLKKFNAKQVEIEELKYGGWKVMLSEGGNLLVRKTNAEGELQVEESHGVFAVAKEQLDFALKSGLIKEGMNDATIATQLADDYFFEWIQDEILRRFYGHVRIKKIWDDRSNHGTDFTGGGEWFITVENDGDFDVSGSDYAVDIRSNAKEKTITIEGKDLYSGSEETLRSGYVDESFYLLDYTVVEPTILLRTNVPTTEIMSKYVPLDGEEYTSYLGYKKLWGLD